MQNLSDSAGHDVRNQNARIDNARIDRTKGLRIRQRSWDVAVQALFETTLRQGHRRQRTVFQKSLAHVKSKGTGQSISAQNMDMVLTWLLGTMLGVQGTKEVRIAAHFIWLVVTLLGSTGLFFTSECHR